MQFKTTWKGWQWQPRATARKFHGEKSNSKWNFESTKERTQKRSKDYLLTTEITKEHTCRAGFDTAEQAGDEQGSVPQNSDLRAGESFVCSGEQQHQWRGAQGVGFISSEGTLASALESAGMLRRRAPRGAHANGRRSAG